jgi:hypothetical protein
VTSERKQQDEKAQPVAGGTGVSETCWFCETRPADPSAVYKVHMHSDVKQSRVSRKTVRTTWRSKSVEIPRCEQCRNWHLKVSVFSYGAAALLFLIPIFGCALAGWQPDPLLAVGLVLGGIAPLVGVLVWGRLMRRRGVGKAAQDAKTTHPGVQALKEQGWKIGKKPPGVT